MFLTQQIWSHFQKTFDKLIFEQNFMNYYYVFHSFHHRKSDVEIISTRDCHDKRVLHKCMETFDHNYVL